LQRVAFAVMLSHHTQASGAAVHGIGLVKVGE